MVSDIWSGITGSNPKYLTNASGTLYFYASDGVHGSELWKSDGSSAGTVMVKDISLFGNSAVHKLTNVSGAIFFVASDGVNGQELWTSDGSSAGTVMVKDIRAGSASSFPIQLTNVNGTLFFVPTDGTNGAELW